MEVACLLVDLFLAGFTTSLVEAVAILLSPMSACIKRVGESHSKGGKKALREERCHCIYLPLMNHLLLGKTNMRTTRRDIQKSKRISKNPRFRPADSPHHRMRENHFSVFFSVFFFRFLHSSISNSLTLPIPPEASASWKPPTLSNHKIPCPNPQ